MTDLTTGTGPQGEAGDDAARVIVALCTYRRNRQLHLLLEGLQAMAATGAGRYRLGVVVVDDTAAGEAEVVLEPFRSAFELGLEFRVSGHQNISLARNIGVEAALALDADWIAMTDDDCVPDLGWVDGLLAVQRRTGATAVSGRLVRRAPAGAPAWLSRQPFLQQGISVFEDGVDMPIASTHNSMTSGSWLREHPDVRFDPALGRLGGEDMVFFRTAREHGLRIAYAREGIVYEDQVPDRWGFGYLVRNSWWLGNSKYVTLVETGAAGRGRMLVHGLTEIGRAVVRPLRNLLSRRAPELRYALTLVAGGVGIVAGALGVRVNHH